MADTEVTKPLTWSQRLQRYADQSPGRTEPTPRQRRRLAKKQNQAAHRKAAR